MYSIKLENVYMVFFQGDMLIGVGGLNEDPYTKRQ